MFLQRLIELIERNGITRNKLLADLGLNKSSFFDWERRGTTPSGEVIAKIADYFHVSTDYLLGRTDIPDMAHPLGVSNELPPDEARLLAAYRRADDHARQMVDLALKPFTESLVPPAQPGAAV